jgi:hypothetical protein
MQPVRPAAIKVDPLPRNESSTISSRIEQSRSASAMSPTGLDGLMQLVQTPLSLALEKVAAQGYSPDIGSVAAMLAEFDVVAM